MIINGRNRERGEKVAQSLTGNGCKTVFVQAEMEKVDDCRKLIAAADQHFGKVHILVNSAAFTERGSIWDTSPELYDQMMDVNIRAPFFLMQDAIKLMERTGEGGSIVNISSVVSYGGAPFLTAYAASKGALNILTKNVAYSVARSRIRVNALNLGWMDTASEDTIQRRYHSNGEDWLKKQKRPTLWSPAQARRSCTCHRLSRIGRVGHNDWRAGGFRSIGDGWRSATCNAAERRVSPGGRGKVRIEIERVRNQEIEEVPKIFYTPNLKSKRICR